MIIQTNYIDVAGYKILSLCVRVVLQAFALSKKIKSLKLPYFIVYMQFF